MIIEMALSQFLLKDGELEKTGLIKYDGTVFKIKLQWPKVASCMSSANYNSLLPQIKDVLCAILYQWEEGRSHQPIETNDLFVRVSLNFWKTAKKLGFRKKGKDVGVFDHVILFNILVKDSSVQQVVDNRLCVQSNLETAVVETRKSPRLQHQKDSTVLCNKRVSEGNVKNAKRSSKKSPFDQICVNGNDHQNNVQGNSEERVFRKRSSVPSNISLKESDEDRKVRKRHSESPHFLRPCLEKNQIYSATGTIEMCSQENNPIRCSAANTDISLTLINQKTMEHPGKKISPKSHELSTRKASPVMKTKKIVSKCLDASSSCEKGDMLMLWSGFAQENHSMSKNTKSSCTKNNEASAMFGTECVQTRSQRSRRKKITYTEESLSEDSTNEDEELSVSQFSSVHSSYSAKKTPQRKKKDDDSDEDFENVPMSTKKKKIVARKRKKKEEPVANVDDILGVSYKKTKFKKKIELQRQAESKTSEETTVVSKESRRKRMMYKPVEEPVCTLPEVQLEKIDLEKKGCGKRLRSRGRLGSPSIGIASNSPKKPKNCGEENGQASSRNKCRKKSVEDCKLIEKNKVSSLINGKSNYLQNLNKNANTPADACIQSEMEKSDGNSYDVLQERQQPLERTSFHSQSDDDNLYKRKGENPVHQITDIEKEDLEEIEKLQRLAQPSAVVNDRYCDEKKKRRSSGFWGLVDTVLTPVKTWIRGESK